MSAEQFKDYNIVYQRIMVNNKPMLRVMMVTKDFGKLFSACVNITDNEDLNEKLLGTLADDLIDEYEDRLKRQIKQ